MGIELYVQGYGDAGDGGLPKDQVLDIFGLREVTPDDFGFFPLVYGGEAQCHLTVRGEGEIATNVCIHRPTIHAPLWQSLFTLLTTGPYVLFAPGGACPLIGQMRVGGWLPQDMVASLGQPVLIDDAATMLGILFPQEP